MDKLTYEYYRSEMEDLLNDLAYQPWIDTGDLEDTLGRLLEIVKGSWTDGHIQGYTEGKAAGETAWY